MDVEIVTIGNELLLGLTIDTNAAHLARELGAMGIRVARRQTVSDEGAEIGRAVAEGLERTGAVITTGGLGPTADDLTRIAIARLFGRTLHQDPAWTERLHAWWARRGMRGELPASNLLQAMVPDGARVLDNRHGTAPGLWIEDAGGRWVAMLPGVPREMRGLLADELLPILRERVTDGRVIRSRTLRTTGISESLLADRFAPVDRSRIPGELAYLPGLDGVDLRVTQYGLRADEADARLAEAMRTLREIAGDFAYGEDDEDLAAVVLEACRARHWRVAVAESCTAGLLGARLTEPAGASDVFIGGVLAYDDAVKQRELGVPQAMLAQHGAVSEAVVRQMASGIRERLGTEAGVAVTGIAGPSGGTAEKPVGTVWLGLDVLGEVRAQRLAWPPQWVRHDIRWRSAQAALDLLRRQAQRSATG